MDLITQFFTNLPMIMTGWVLPILFVLTLVVFFHELGHFLVARWCGVDVDAFSIGFGSEIFGFTDSKNTRWKFCWIPLGGYVKFKDDANPASSPDNEALEQLSAEEKAGSFHLKPLWQRSLVVAAGPIASFLLGIIIFAGIKYTSTEQGPSTLVHQVLKGSAAEKAGIRKGDVITHINGEATPFFNDILRIVSLSAHDPLDLTIKRQNEQINLIITPKEAIVDNGFGKKVSVGRLGVASSEDKSTWITRNYTFPGAVSSAVQETKFIITATLGYIGKLFVGKEKLDKLSGPVGISKIINKVSELGLKSTIYIAGALSISIGLFNLFPIPMLDGGHLMFYAIEAVRGKPASEEVMEYSFRAGLALLLFIMLVATIGDINLFS